jgi:carboxyl-terminal processing protease
MKKISIPACLCACLLTLCLTLTAVFIWQRILPRRDRGEYTAEDKLAEAADIIRENYIGEYEESELTDRAIDAMVASLNDRWSYYMTAEEVAAYEMSSRNSYGGIGIVVQDSEDNVARVLKVYEHSPAGEAGVFPGSLFLAVNGQDVSGMDKDSVVDLVRSAIARGQVVLRFLCPDGAEREYSLTPGDVYTEPVRFQALPSGLGYVRVENFEGRSAESAIAAVESLRARQVPGIIFDVRENPGGQLSELLKLLDYILPEGKLFISRNIDGSEDIDYSQPSCVELPMVVLINEDSYSAAEFFAAALREYDWAELVGAQTSGKGYAQITVPMTDGSAIHISHIAYFTPKGVCLAGVGLTPDLSVELGEEERTLLYYDMLPLEEDPQLAAAEQLLLERASVSP